MKQCDECGLCWFDNSRIHTAEECLNQKSDNEQYLDYLEREDEHEQEHAQKVAEQIPKEELNELREKLLKLPHIQDLMFRGRLRAIMFDHVPYKHWKRVVHDPELMNQLIDKINFVPKEEFTVKFITLADFGERVDFHVRYTFPSTERKFDLYVNRQNKDCRTNVSGGGSDMHDNNYETTVLSMLEE
jgi:hypothetical protein